MNIKRKIIILLCVVGVTCVMAACRGGGGEDVPLTEPLPTSATPAAPTEIPAAATDTSEAESAPAEIPPLEVVMVNSYTDHYGSYRVVGLVKNNSSQAVEDIEVEVEIFDAGGLSLHSDIVRAALDIIAPGEISPFALWASESLPGAESATATVVGHSVGEIGAYVDIRGTTVAVDDDGDVHVSGELYNSGGDPVQINGLAAATFDTAGNLITAEAYSVASRYLDPGEDGPFRVTMIGPAEEIANITEYLIYVDAEYTAPEDYYDLILSEPTNNYVDTNNIFHLVGEITNNTEEYLSVELLAAIYADDGNIIDVASTNLPIYSLAPGETLPYDFDDWGLLNYKYGAIDDASTFSVQWDPYWTWISETEYVDLLTQNDFSEFDDGYGRFTGEVVNDSGSVLSSAVVIVSLYDAETGQIVAMGYESLFDEIPAGESAEYEVYLDTEPGLDIDAIEYVITVKGELP
ncbi:MAG: FxLYD domain-containing protein [Chloroflexi bacterium]|nr:FxLYD domain-containing protein [Chloroflexota bacterium]